MADALPNIVHRPIDVSRLTIAEIATLENTKLQAIEILGGISGLFNPARPGNVVSVIGLSGNWKTGFMVSELRREASKLDPAGNECCLYVTWEEAVEECGILDVANEARIDVDAIIRGNISDWGAIKRAAVKRGTLPIYVIGHSFANRKARARMTMTDVAKAVYALEDILKLRVKLAAMDYLQLIPADKGKENETTRLVVNENAQRIKDMALALYCPVIMACQAKQELMERDWKVPRMSDAMESSVVMHVSNTIVGLWRPQTTDAGGLIGDPPFKVDPSQLIVGNAKQRRGETGNMAVLNVDYATNTVRGEWAFNTVNLND